MLKAYIELTWSEFLKFSPLVVLHLPRQLGHLEFTMTKPAFVQELNLDTVPWDLLDTVSLRRKLLVNPEPFSHVKTLDPMRMSPHDVYDVLALLVKGQDSGVRMLEFSIGDTFNSDAGSNSEIIELSSQRDDGANATTEPDNDVSERSESPIHPPKHTTDSETSTASPRDEGTYNRMSLISTPPVISPPPQSTALLSESMIEVAIKKVAEAGYLGILDANSDGIVIDAPNQVLPNLKTVAQQSGKGSTSNSKSKKRRQEEMEQGEDEQKKKHTVAFPTREQSSRYDVLNNFLGQVSDIFLIASKMPNTRTSTLPSAPDRTIN